MFFIRIQRTLASCNINRLLTCLGIESATWTREDVADRLHKIMIAIHKTRYESAEMYGTPGNFVNGANIGGFLKVADAMLDQGLVQPMVSGEVI